MLKRSMLADLRPGEQTLQAEEVGAAVRHGEAGPGEDPQADGASLHLLLLLLLVLLL